VRAEARALPIVSELAIVLVLSAAIGYYLLSQVGQGPNASVPTSVSLLAAFYYPLSFPVDAMIKLLPLERGVASQLALFATIVIQNVLLWAIGRWLAKGMRATR
jgi:hypothetical protein